MYCHGIGGVMGDYRDIFNPLPRPSLVMLNVLTCAIDGSTQNTQFRHRPVTIGVCESYFVFCCECVTRGSSRVLHFLKSIRGDSLQRIHFLYIDHFLVATVCACFVRMNPL